MPFAFLEVLGGIDEQHVIGLFALFQYQNAHRNAGREKQVGGQADHGVDVAIFEQLGADAFFRAASEQDAVGRMMAMTPSGFR